MTQRGDRAISSTTDLEAAIDKLNEDDLDIARRREDWGVGSPPIVVFLWNSLRLVYRVIIYVACPVLEVTYTQKMVPRLIGVAWRETSIVENYIFVLFNFFAPTAVINVFGKTWLCSPASNLKYFSDVLHIISIIY